MTVFGATPLAIILFVTKCYETVGISHTVDCFVNGSRLIA
ncbi:hypothetical protein PQD74_gp061 [Stenotrophomonas phage Siara]|uniref:Uncharacterized protein n=1 Tax=Stenotrophomonas phage Siara TaxID=2859658 RepID=A0AAE7WMB5_9CAUD|nr:hypothetical protein PQD74_gp061 [Stenotrophomonas phage Siara]QYW02103.1 hypothetical protein CPT_Siara_103 [Stenotrophomonas phage Siara]